MPCRRIAPSRYLALGLKNADSLRMPAASLASLAALAACRASAALAFAASLGSNRGFFSEDCEGIEVEGNAAGWRQMAWHKDTLQHGQHTLPPGGHQCCACWPAAMPPSAAQCSTTAAHLRAVVCGRRRVRGRWQLVWQVERLQRALQVE